MATKDIKHLLDAIIGDDSDKDSDEDGNETVVAKALIKPAAFNSDEFREKLSLCVLKDIVSAMMHDETKDLDEMIDQSIMQHIRDDYRGTCFGYLCRARNKIQSPILSSIVQEIEDKTKMVKEGVEEGTEEATDAVNNPEQTTADMLKTVTNYDELRAKLKDEVSKKVVNDVAKVITKSNDAPVFDNIDTKLKKIDNTNDEEPGEGESGMDTGAPEEDMESTGMDETDPMDEGTDENTPPTDEGMEENSDTETPPPPPQPENDQEDTTGNGANPIDTTNNTGAASESLIMRMTGNIVTEFACKRQPITTEEGINRAIITFCIGEMDALMNYDMAKTIVTKYL